MYLWYPHFFAQVGPYRSDGACMMFQQHWGVSTKKCFFGVHTNVRHLRSAVLKVEQHQGYQVTTVYHPVPAIGALGP